MRRLIAASLVIVILAGAWSAGWFALASWVEGRVGSVLSEAAERGVAIDCREREVTGFPFAMRVACGATAVAERTSGSQAEIAGVTGGASVFAPMTAEIRLDSPASVASPLLERAAAFEWRDARIDVGLGMNGPQAVSFETAGVDAAVPLRELADTRIVADAASGTLSPNSDGGTAASVAFSKLAVTARGETFPPLDGTAAAQLSAPPRALLAGRAGLQAPLSARAIRVSLASGEVRLEAEGDIAIDAEGVLDGAIALRVAGAGALPAFIASLPQETQRIANATAGALFAFGRPATIDGETASELLLEIRRGEAKIGPVEFRVPNVPL